MRIPLLAGFDCIKRVHKHVARGPAYSSSDHRLWYLSVSVIMGTMNRFLMYVYVGRSALLLFRLHARKLRMPSCLPIICMSICREVAIAKSYLGTTISVHKTGRLIREQYIGQTRGQGHGPLSPFPRTSNSYTIRLSSISNSMELWKQPNNVCCAVKELEREGPLSEKKFR